MVRLSGIEPLLPPYESGEVTITSQDAL